MLELVLPVQCIGCGGYDAAARPLCAACAEQLLGLVGRPSCPRCGAGIGENLPVEERGCISCPTPMPRFDRVVRLTAYEPPLAEVIRSLKFRRLRHGIRWMGAMLAAKIQTSEELASIELVQPVPLHWVRRFGRGFDQARLLADATARKLRIPTSNALVRTRNTPPQVNLPRTRRLENVKGAFGVGKPNRVSGRHVLLIDDVTTTGATASEAARAMLDAGARRISLAVLAKAEPPAAFTPAHR